MERCGRRERKTSRNRTENKLYVMRIDRARNTTRTKRKTIYGEAG